MRITYLYVFLFLGFSCSCKQHSTVGETPAGTDTAKQESLYPYPQYIQSQVAYVDSALLGIEMIVYENGIRKDSLFISKAAFNKLASAFLEPDLNDNRWRKEYQETSFQDLSLNAITFSISTSNPDLPVQKADILLDPGTKQVKFVLIKKQLQKNDLFESSNLMWVHNMNFQISSTITDDQQVETTRIIKVTWDKPFNRP